MVLCGIFSLSFQFLSVIFGVYSYPIWIIIDIWNQITPNTHDNKETGWSSKRHHISHTRTQTKPHTLLTQNEIQNLLNSFLSAEKYLSAYLTVNTKTSLDNPRTEACIKYLQLLISVPIWRNNQVWLVTEFIILTRLEDIYIQKLGCVSARSKIMNK